MHLASSWLPGILTFLTSAALCGAAPVSFKNAVAHETAPTNAAANLPSPSIEAILARSSTKAALIGWVGNDGLVIEYTRQGKREIRQLALKDGTLGPVLAGNDWSISPDGHRRIHREADGWVIDDTSDRSVHVPMPNPDFRIRLVSRPVWSEDGNHVAIIARISPAALPSEPPVRTSNGVRTMDYDELSGRTPISSAFVAIVDVSKLLAAPGTSVRWHEITERMGDPVWDAHGVFFGSAKFMVKEPYTVVNYLGIDADAPREVYRSRGRFQMLRPIPSPDGRLLAIGIDADTRCWDAFASIVLVDPATGRELRRLTHDVPVLSRSMQWSRDGRQIHCIIRQGGLDQLASIDLDGNVRYHVRTLSKHLTAHLSPDGARMAYETHDGYGRIDVRELDLATGGERIVLVIDDPAKEFRLSEFHRVRWKSTETISPYGYVFLPPDFDASRKYPLLVDVHGGGPGSSLYLEAPITISTTPGPLEWHVWASLGYVVFVPDYRSTGYYGPIPAMAQTAPYRDILRDDVSDVVSGVKFMMEQPFIDPGHAAIFGHSAGGARTYRLLTEHGDLFRAAVINEGAWPDFLSNMLDLSTGTHTGREFEGVMRDLVGATLAESPDSYKRNSMFDSHRIKTATLIMVGSEKLGGIFQLPLQVLYSVLRSKGTPTRLLAFPDEGHNYTRPESAARAFHEARDWFATQLAP